MPNFYFCAFLPAIICLGVVLFKSRQAEPHARRQMLIIAGPFILGLFIAALANNAQGMAAGFIGSAALFVWLARFRFPASFYAARPFIKAGDWAQALELLNQAVRARPNMWEVYQVRSVVHSSAGHFTNGERDAQKALQLKPDVSYNYNALGLAYWRQNDFEPAKQAYLEAYRLAPQTALHQYCLALAHFCLDEFSEAEKLLHMATKRKQLMYLSQHQCLLATYYLARAQEAQGKTTEAQRNYRKMGRFVAGLAELKQQPKWDSNPIGSEEVIADIERRLATQ